MISKKIEMSRLNGTLSKCTLNTLALFPNALRQGFHPFTRSGTSEPLTINCRNLKALFIGLLETLMINWGKFEAPRNPG